MQVCEIFTSLSGELDGFNTQGGLATFVRLQKCNLNCTWCDTEHARGTGGGIVMTVEEVAKQCTCKHVIITGGEPLLQLEEVYQLVEELRQYGRSDHTITIETNGAIPILINCGQRGCNYNSLRFVVDYKLGSSGMQEFMQPEVFDNLWALDVIKFVIKDLQDYRQAKELVLRNQQWRCRKIFSPVIANDNLRWPTILANTMIEDKFEEACFALQWHKLLTFK